MNRNLPVEDLLRRVKSDLSVGSRIRLSLLLLVSTAMAGVVVSLWATEPVLPRRTHLAFAAMTTIAASWMTFSAWALTQRRVLLGLHKVVAGRLAVTFSGLFTGGSLMLSTAGGLGRPALVAAAVGAVMLTAALVMLAAARREVRRLTGRREEIEQELAKRR